MKLLSKKLSLSTQKIRVLDSNELTQAVGGSLSGGTSVISVSGGTSVISRNPSGGITSINPSGGSYAGH